MSNREKIVLADDYFMLRFPPPLEEVKVYHRCKMPHALNPLHAITWDDCSFECRMLWPDSVACTSCGEVVPENIRLILRLNRMNYTKKIQIKQYTSTIRITGIWDIK